MLPSQTETDLPTPVSAPLPLYVVPLSWLRHSIGDVSSVYWGAVIAVMVIVVHNGHRGPIAGAASVSLRRRTLRAVIYLGAILISFLILFRVTGSFDVFYKVKALVTDERTSLRSGSGIAAFCRGLQGLAQEQRFQVVLLISAVYMFLQTFCVPGTVALNAAVGAVLGSLLGVPYCTLLGTLGACSCYTLSRTVGVSLVEATDARLMKGRGLPNIRAQVRKYQDDLFVYMLFLRLTPILPNWLVNLASPVVGVPIRVFAAATFFGIVPQTYLTVRFGAVVRKVKRADGEEGPNTSIVTPWDTLLLAVIGLAILVGFRLKKRFKTTASGAGGDDECAGDTLAGHARLRVPVV